MTTPITVLHIEDDELDRRAFTRMVRDKGLPWEVKHAETLAAARSHLAQSRFDVIIADYHLPDGDCTELFDEVRDTPFILVTGTLEEQLALRTLQRGADDYLPKDPEQRHLEALPSAVEKTLYRKSIHETNQRLTREIQRQAEQLRLIMDNVPALVAYIDAQSRYRFVNRQYEVWFGQWTHDIVGKSVREVLGEAAMAELQHRMDRAMAGDTVHFEAEVPFREGGTRWIEAHYLPDRDSGGEVAGFYVMALDITERKRVEEELRAAKLSAEQAKAAAENASRAKDHFLAVLSHELRTPLAPVLPALAIIEKLMPEDGKELVVVARRNVELEARLIDDLLDVTRIARGKIELDRKVVPVCTVLHLAAEVCKPDIDARQLHFAIKVEDGPHPVHVDAARLQQVFWNLIKNAVKFTPQGGCVGVRCWRENGRAIVQVTDSGAGIEAETLPRIFNAFEQESRASTRTFGGLGLGLAISKSLVEMHGGAIHVHSAGKSQGATFTVELPIAEDRLPSRQAASPLAKGALPAAPRALRILLVEDHGDTARMMGRLLTAEGHVVKDAGDVATALELAGREDFDLLISDLDLPDGTGHDLMRQLVANGQHLPAVALSGFGMAADVQKSHEAGFAEHVTKPVNFDVLLTTVNRVANEEPKTT